MGKQLLCDECLGIIKDNLSIEQILILKYLKKENTMSLNLSKDKTAIIPNVKGMTEFKFNSCMNALELVGFVGRNSNKRPNRFYITEDGRKALKLYEEQLKKNLSEMDD